MGETTGLLATESIREYFRTLFGEVRERQRVHLAEMTEFYLANLLAEFLSPEKLFVTREDGSREIEPMAFLLARAVSAPREERIRLLRRMGDVSLYLSGFLSDSLAGQPVDVDYYISMGEGAYGQLAAIMHVPSRAREAAFFGLYDELCSQFGRIVDVFAEISERVAVSTNKGIVRLYERWVKTGSSRLTRLLAEQGVVPMAPPGLAQ